MTEALGEEVSYEDFQLCHFIYGTDGIIDPSKKRLSVEIDIFCNKAVFIAAELTWTLGSGVTPKFAEAVLEKVDKFVENLEYLKLKFCKAPRFFLSVQRKSTRTFSFVS